MWDHIQLAYFERIGAKINPAGIVEIPLVCKSVTVENFIDDNITETIRDYFK